MRDAGLQKDQGNGFLDALGLIVISSEDSRRNSAAVHCFNKIYGFQDMFTID